MGVQIREVTEDEQDIRLDRWFKNNFPELKHGQLEKLLRKGQIRVDGKRMKANARLNSGQEVRVPPFRADYSVYEKKVEELSDADIKFMKSLVLYKDDDVIAINKPAGLPTQGGSKQNRHVDGMLDALKFDGQRPKLVHRLDKDTTGVLLLARTAQAAKSIGYAFKEREARKYYWGITVGAPDRDEGVIDVPLAKAQGRGGERMMARDDEEGKSAVTYFKVMERVGKRSSWLAFWPRTGRTHQIRVHAELIGTPLLGDRKYIGDGSLLQGTEGSIYDGLHLHARRLVIPYVLGGKKKLIDVVAPLPDSMKKTWKYFGFDANDKTDPFEDIRE